MVGRMLGAELIHGDRRTDGRYVFELPLRFLYRSGEVCYSGAGRTKDLGRKGIRFVGEDSPPEGADVELRIEWPFLLQDVCALELRVWGRVLRNDEEGAVVRMGRYEFRTRGDRSFDQAAAGAGNWSIVA